MTLTAAPDANVTFAGWGGARLGVAANQSCTITTAADTLVVARFEATPPLETSYYHLDTLGSVRVVTDDAGQEIARHDYFPFGEDNAPLTGDPRRFTGKERDAETALDYFGARYYRNVWGRSTSTDPAGGRVIENTRVDIVR